MFFNSRGGLTALLLCVIPILEVIMRRSRMSRSSSKRSFRKGASRVHGLNSSGASYNMRGGIRL